MKDPLELQKDFEGKTPKECALAAIEFALLNLEGVEFACSIVAMNNQRMYLKSLENALQKM